MVRRDVAVFNPIEIPAAHCPRVNFQIVGDVFNYAFDSDHALRCTETAHRRVRHRIRLAQMTSDDNVRDEVAVFSVADRPLNNRQRHINHRTAPALEINIQRGHHAFVVKADVICDDIVMTFSGNDHVVIAIQTELHGTPCLPCSQSRNRRNDGRLTFLAAETAAHKRLDYPHPMRRFSTLTALNGSPRTSATPLCPSAGFCVEL